MSRWIQKALKKHKKGSLHKQLGIPKSETIPKTLLNKIQNAEVGKTISNPTTVGKKRIKVTGLVKKRAVVTNTLRGFK